ncbi:MAG TPA: serine/threonine protein kinase, partial [Catenuloplanes sp.]
GAQPPPGGTPQASPPPTSTPPAATTAPAPTVGQAAANFRVHLDDGLASGDIRADVGQDLRSLSGGLRDAERDVAPLANELRRKVNVRAREGAITDQYAGILENAIDRILAVA